MVPITIIKYLIVLLHLDKIQMKPRERDTEERQGPCIGMDCLHGVLMHNDDNQGDKHMAEDQYLRFKGVLDTDTPKTRPLDAEAQMHGVLMHSDSKKKDHDFLNKNMLPEQLSTAGPKDLNDVVHEGMHGDDGSNVQHDVKDEIMGGSENKGPSGEKFMHGVLMHGDENFEHSEDIDENISNAANVNEKTGPKDAEELLHGVLMHGDSEPDKKHEHLKPVETNTDGNQVGPNNDLHGILMHGDSKVGHDHSNEDASISHNVFSDLSKIKGMGFDRDLLKVIDIENILLKDKKEYAEWIKNTPQNQDESKMESTLVSESVLQDIELMKKRYLAKTNLGARRKVEIPKQWKDDHPFTAEDAKAVYDENIHAGGGEDMRHDLELLGSTEPLNARHKAKLALVKSKPEK